MKAEIENTYAEAFKGLYCRMLVTADDEQILRNAAEDATATPSIVIGRVEGGIEKWVIQDQTPDGRKGVILQFWGGINKRKPLPVSVKNFEAELSYRIRQDILVKPFTALFNYLPNPEGCLDMMERVGHCGDGFEWEEKNFGRHVIIIPLMVSNFRIERYLGFATGIMGANFWYMCKTKKAVLSAGRKALAAIHKVEGVITPFEICSAGSKPESKFPLIGPTTNHIYCPSLKKKLKYESKVPEGINFIPEIVINGVSLEAVKAAMSAGIEAIRDIDSVERISAGNYGGKLGEFQIWLKELSLNKEGKEMSLE
ncbi:MAG: formylmethanofuran--tetrahydromethanopterin N-formyltransferase [Candidatus Bathyarchaeota archaeon]|nr:MAG: formylmethanofuran--tetrahydromethanopterin N-formyltransferase [Candidatus Bathyarchaeota archaeon]